MQLLKRMEKAEARLQEQGAAAYLPQAARQPPLGPCASRAQRHFDLAQRLADSLGFTVPVRLKIDQNGLGHGAVGMLKIWAENSRHRAEIVGVMVSESPGHDDPGAVMRPFKKRDEMWLATRALLQPDPGTGVCRLRLRTDRNAAIQLTTPKLQYNSGGHTVIESKKAMRARGMKNPDRAEAVLLAVYEPEPIIRRGGGLLV
ncbi:hypothetical protein [Streptomyces sp. NPDC053367]|uniref:hypothetical protein n=1 Tax=Streptomyces sp. NPDC053367 TaxID=3365700 RepID=UPI0037D74A3A